MPNSGGTSFSALPAGKIRRLPLHLHPPPSPTPPWRVLTVSSGRRGRRRCSFPIRQQRRRPEPPRALLLQGGSGGGRRRPARSFPIRRQRRRPAAPRALLPYKAAVREAKIGANRRATTGEGGGPSRVGESSTRFGRSSWWRRGRSGRREVELGMWS
jgi:hypothetical protein